MKRNIITLLLMVLAMSQTMAQTYDNLWKQASDLQKKDLPKSELCVMKKIICKATVSKDYGQLLAAELRQAMLWNAISPDSLAPAIKRMEAQTLQTNDPMLKAVWNAVLGKLYREHRFEIEPGDEEVSTKKSAECFKKALANPALLAQHTSVEYVPLALKGIDGNSFGNDMLHLIGFEADTQEAYLLMHDYYTQVGNRGAACLCAFEMIQKDRQDDVKEVRKSKYLNTIDSIIHEYRDLPEAGELAVEHYRFLEGATDAKPMDKINYINYALSQWGGWSRMNVLRNAQKRLTEPMFSLSDLPTVLLPERKQWLHLRVRNLQTVTVAISRLNITADNNYNVNDAATYKMLRKKTAPLHQKDIVRQYYGHPDYAEVTDSFELAGLPIGAYLMEVTADNAGVEPLRKLFYVSDLALLSQQLPDGSARHVVVSATTGQPIAGAKIQQRKDGYILISAAVDKYTPAEYSHLSRVRYYEQRETCLMGRLYTDRAIYRPGQAVHATVLLFNNEKGSDAKALGEGEEVKFSLRDANWKVVTEMKAKTDAYGTASVDFQLPEGGQNGQYCILTDKGGTSRYFRVEEYKRPTFEITFPKVNEKYTWGDTVVVKASAKTYAGVPVQGAKVEYTVTRRSLLWWWGSRSADLEVKKGTGVTREDGTFDVEIPLEASPSEREKAGMGGFLRKARFFNFDVEAIVTDLGGESHQGEMSLPLGTKSTAFSVDLPKRIETDSLKTVTFSYRNSAGIDIAAPVRYRIDKGEWESVASNTPIYIAGVKSSGVHELEAICGQDTLQQKFTLFSMKDTHPMEKTIHWSYQTADQFPRDGKPVYLQVGSSENGVYIVYSIIAGNKLLEKGAWELGDSIVTLPFTYKPEYASGVVLNYSFVKEGQCYTNMMRIARPLPDKQLNVTWKTFRNRLTPGQKEEWTLNITTSDGKPAKAQLMSVLYDKALDRLKANNWGLSLGFYNSLPSCNWTNNLSLRRGYGNLGSSYPTKYFDVRELEVDHFDDRYFSGGFYKDRMLFAVGSVRGQTVEAVRYKASAHKMNAAMGMMVEDRSLADEEPSGKTSKELDNVQVRENLNETAFFYPALESDEKGDVAIKFTLPESITTWKFMALAHDKEMRNGSIVDEAVAKKTVMVQPNMPRFLREGDRATIVTKLFNTSDKKVGGNIRMQLIDPETNKMVWQKAQKYNIDADGTATVNFDLPEMKEGIYINKVVAAGNGYSDGEQHYLPVLSNQEVVTNTLPFTLTEKGMKDFDLTHLYPSKGTLDTKMTVEYTNNPSWLMIQALPSLDSSVDDNAISLMSAIYSNSITRHYCKFIKNFDEAQNASRLSTQVAKLKTLQNGDGSFSWWKGMQGSRYMTTAVAEMMVRLNSMVGIQKETTSMLTAALRYLQKLAAKEVKEMKEAEEKDDAKNLRPSEEAVNYLYILSLDGRKLNASVAADVDYLMKRLVAKTCDFTIYGKALTAVVLGKHGYRQKADEYLQSINEYSVYKPEMGRYFDTRKAYYSWRDYKIPTQVAAIEAMQTLAADKMKQSVGEMQLWLLQSKRTQAWETPVNTVNAVYAFLNGREQVLDKTGANAALKLDGKTLPLPGNTEERGYVKVSSQGAAKTLIIDKKNDGTSWGAVYAEFKQTSSEVSSAESGIRVTRKLSCDKHAKVGDRVKVTIEIVADRDYDFVQIIDKRAACLEPASQLSGYQWGQGCYVSPRDNTTNFYFDRLSKGKHFVEMEYYVDRKGDYQSGSCTAQCTYSPEFCGRDAAYKMTIDNK